MSSDFRWAVAGAVLLVATLGAGQYVGVSGREFAPGAPTHRVATALEAYQALGESGVSGRTLVLLDERSGIVPRTWMATFMDSLDDPSVEPPVMSHNLTSCLIYSGIVREVYFVPPDSRWDLEFQRLSSRPDALQDDAGVRIRFYGVPVRLVRAADLPMSTEQVIVYADEGLLAEYDQGFLAALEKTADVVVTKAER